jgi:hypothetical protein
MMNIKDTSIYFLSLVVGLFVFSPSASYAACTPVVYAFRHAEDESKSVAPFPCLPGSTVNCTTALTKVGKEHADLYNEMITNFEMIHDYCAVKYVYSVNPILPGGFAGGTTNPFETARPLANDVMNLDPLIKIGDDIIDEFLTVVEPQMLKVILLGHAEVGASSALFWTSDGLHDLGLALGTDIIPEKTEVPKFSPPRNAAYVFKFFEGERSEGFIPPSKPDEYVQCFNVKPEGGISTDKYYCGKNNGHGSLSVPEKDFDSLHGRICATAGLPGETADYYGYCESPPAGSPP